jgi:hypothetical protein
VHPQRKLNNRRVQERFLQRLAGLLPPQSAPVIVVDAGFKVPALYFAYRCPGV